MLFETQALIDTDDNFSYLGVGKPVILTGTQSATKIVTTIRDNCYSLVIPVRHMSDLRSLLCDLHENLYVGSVVNLETKKWFQPQVSEFISAIADRDVIEAQDGKSETLKTGLYLDLEFSIVETIMESLAFYTVTNREALTSVINKLKRDENERTTLQVQARRDLYKLQPPVLRKRD